MTLADNIRDYVILNIIEPARKDGKRMVTVNATDIHEALKLVSRYPAVCSALDANKFLEIAKITLINREGPKQSTTAKWTFGL